MRKPLFMTLTMGILFLTGCLPHTPPPVRTLSDAQKKLVALCEKEYGFTPVVRPLANTLWVYVPMETPIIEVKANDGEIKKEDRAQNKLTINFLDGNFANNTFVLRYDISKKKSYPQDTGYGSSYGEEYIKRYRFTMTAIARAYGDFEDSPDGDGLVQRAPGDIDFVGAKKNAEHKTLVHAYVPTEKAPTFFIIVIADIVHGIEMRAYGTLKDLRRGLSDPSFTGEYIQRIFQETPTGNKAIIGDKDGRHIDFQEMTWGEFLSRQIQSRIKLKYAQNDPPPGDDPDDVILGVIARTVGSYQFTAFRGVSAQNLETGQDLSISPQQLSTFAQ